LCNRKFGYYGIGNNAWKILNPKAYSITWSCIGCETLCHLEGGTLAKDYSRWKELLLYLEESKLISGMQ
jgi:hypothetical protein